MNMLNREQTLLEVIRKGLFISGNAQAEKTLGDRKTYIGMSDMSRYIECPRYAVHSKLYPESQELSSLLMLQRGHWFEAGIGQSLLSLGLNVLNQLEICLKIQGSVVKAHLDFTLVWGTPQPAVRILEVKSMEQIPDTPYASHELQVHGQVGLLCEYWNKPVFNFTREDGITLSDETFPSLCQKCFGIIMPDNPEDISVEAWILCVSMKEAKGFGPYLHSDTLLDGILGNCISFWNDLQSAQANSEYLNELSYAKGFYPLCSYCEYSHDCPKFSNSDYQPDWEQAIATLETLKAERSKSDAQIKEIETALKDVCLSTNGNDWISTDTHRFKASVSTRKTLSRDLLLHELENIFTERHLTDLDPRALIASCEQESAPYARLTINKIK